MALAHSVDQARRRTPTAGDIGLAAIAGFAAFAVANAIFDLTSFIQVPYLFCFIAGLCSVAATRRAPEPIRLHRRVPVG